MPEGDSIHRIARALAGELSGRAVQQLEVRGQGVIAELAGTRVTDVTAMGKHLLIGFEAGWTLRLHLGMHGTVRKLHARERRPAATALLVAGDAAYVCVRAYRAELIRSMALRVHPRLARLGPDLLEDPPRLDDIVVRATAPAHANREIADVLLDQRIASGIGNVWKSEALFVRRIHPRTRVGSLTRDDIRALYEEAASLLRSNLDTRRRTSVPLRRRPQPASDRLWVYGRGGKPCLECRTAITRIAQGDMARSTYFCPECQVGGTGD